MSPFGTSLFAFGASTMRSQAATARANGFANTANAMDQIANKDEQEAKMLGVSVGDYQAYKTDMELQEREDIELHERARMADLAQAWADVDEGKAEARCREPDLLDDDLSGRQDDRDEEAES